MKDRIRVLIAKIRYRMGRGESWFHYFYRMGIIVTGVKLWGFSTAESIGIAVGAVMGWYILGYVDEMKVKIWQTENKIATTELNPYFKELMDKVDTIETRLSRIEKGKGYKR